MKTRPVAVLTAMLLVAGIALAGFAAIGFLSNPSLNYSCSGSGQRVLEGQMRFVKDHLSDASGLTVQTFDCNSASSAFVEFDSQLAPPAVRDIFLADPSCTLTQQSDPEGEMVVCGTGEDAVSIFLTDGTSGGTRGELYLERH